MKVYSYNTTAEYTATFLTMTGGFKPWLPVEGTPLTPVCLLQFNNL